MDIGQLFLNLGIKGSEKTVGALSNVKKGLQETASMSLEAKAGIVAAMYALERLFATSGKAGTELTNFNALLGGGTQVLQQYQYAARQVGVSNQEVEGSFKTLQSVVTKTLTGEGAPKGLARVSLLTGGITPQDLQKYQQSPQLLIQKLQEYAKKETNIGLRNETLKSFGLGENMVAALSRNAFRPEVLKKAPTYSDNEIGKLDKANIAWSNLGTKIEMAVGHFNAKHGDQLVGDISKIVDQVLKLIEAFTALSEKLKLFEVLGKVFDGWTNILGGVSGAVESITGAIQDPKKRDPLKQNVIEGGKNLLGYTGDAAFQGAKVVGGLGLSGAGVVGKGALNALFANGLTKNMGLGHVPTLAELHAMRDKDPTMGGRFAAPPMRATASTAPTQNNNVSITNTFAHPGVDPKKTGDSIHKSVQQAYRQMSAQARGT